LETVGEIISAMRAVAPPGKADLDDVVLQKLRNWTSALLSVKQDADEEYERFLQIRDRGIAVPAEDLAAWLRDKKVLVVGGTGCIGSGLIRQIQPHRPRQITSVSRGASPTWEPPQQGVDYRHLDIRHASGLGGLFQELRPDIVFHLAGQRDPGLAERDVHRTVTTNIFGTRNVMAAAAAAGAQQVIHASTGKAMRPYSSDVYAATKHIAEFVAHREQDFGQRCSAARFTHIVDNSIVHNRLLEAAKDQFFRLHGPDVVFYAQSAKESAQLLLLAGLKTPPGGLRMHAIRELGWPINLVDLAVGALRSTQSRSPLYFSGFDRGYDDTVMPGLFDPATAGEVSPLFNRFEAARAEPSSGQTDMFEVIIDPSQPLEDAMHELESVCGETKDPAKVRGALDAVSWALLDATLEATSAQAVRRAVNPVG
jgi:nucleoside-diphosphate-sugar epimerase